MCLKTYELSYSSDVTTHNFFLNRLKFIKGQIPLISSIKDCRKKHTTKDKVMKTPYPKEKYNKQPPKSTHYNDSLPP
jgi:hypothetical protein